MKIMPCPLNGPRNISEFTYGGELKAMPDSATCTDAEWADWWMHNASSYWFLAERHTGSDEILRTFDPKEVFTQRVDFHAPAQEVRS